MNSTLQYTNPVPLISCGCCTPNIFDLQWPVRLNDKKNNEKALMPILTELPVEILPLTLAAGDEDTLKTVERTLAAGDADILELEGVEEVDA